MAECLLLRQFVCSNAPISGLIDIGLGVKWFTRGPDLGLSYSSSETHFDLPVRATISWQSLLAQAV